MNERASRAKALNQYLDPYPNFGRLRKAGRVVQIRTTYYGPGWLITRHEDAQAVAGDPRLSVESHNANPELQDRLSRAPFRFFDYLDVTIPRADLVFVGVASANHDPDRFPDPERFDVTRQVDGHLTLGRGPHYCLGAPLGRLEMEVLISTLLEEYPAMRLACDPADIEWRASALRGPVAVPVLLAPQR